MHDATTALHPFLLRALRQLPLDGSSGRLQARWPLAALHLPWAIGELLELGLAERVGPATLRLTAAGRRVLSAPRRGRPQTSAA